MKKMLAGAAFVIMGISILALYVSAQGVRPYVVGKGKGVPPTKEIVLLQAVSQEEGYREGVQIISQPANAAALTNGTLRIDMSDGSVQEIPLLKVKKLRVETQ